MTDTKTITNEDRRSALDAFAESAPLPVVIEQGTKLPGEARVFGAQRVAVKRDLTHVRKNLIVLASMAGSDWFYRFPVSDKGAKKNIEGPSIKLANEVAREFGNCDVDCRAYDLGDSWLLYARFADLETGFSLTRPFQQRKSQGTLRTRDPQRAEDIAFQIGVSKAIRNVICNALQGLCDFAFEQARGEMVGKIGKNLRHYRQRIDERLAELGVDHARVEAVVGKPIGKWLAPDMAKIIAEIQAVADGMADPADIWPVDGEAPSGVEKQRSRRSHKPEIAGAAPAAAPTEPPSLVQIRTKLWACGTHEAVDNLWSEEIEPIWESLTKQVREQLAAERMERITKIVSSLEGTK